jgi:hypothetical protein
MIDKNDIQLRLEPDQIRLKALIDDISTAGIKTLLDINHKTKSYKVSQLSLDHPEIESLKIPVYEGTNLIGFLKSTFAENLKMKEKFLDIARPSLFF